MADIKWRGDDVSAQVRRAVEDALTRLAERIAWHARNAMGTPKHGVHYVGMPTRSSAPYEAPAAQTARLRHSIHVEQRAPLERLIGTNLDYGLYLEVGTSKMVERPYLRPALYEYTGRAGEEVFEHLI